MNLYVNFLLILIVPPANLKCISVMIPQFASCATKDGHIPDPPKGTCQDIRVCRKQFNVSYIKLEPISNGVFRNLVTRLIRLCCGPCTDITPVNFFNDTMQINQFSINSSDIVFPIVGRSNAKRLYGYNFIPLLEAHGAYYISKSPTPESILNRLAMSCLNLWPLLIIMILTSLIAGFIIWIIETWNNKAMFSRTFMIGLFEGFWWSFISMTTVGYGDKVPTFVIARLFSVLWIVVGITIISMFTASLSTEIASAVTQPTPDIAGKTVGVIRQQLHDIAMVAEHGGIIKETKGVNLSTDVMELITNLKTNQIDGFLLEKIAYVQTIKYFHSNNGTNDDRQFFENKTTKTEKTFRNIKLSFGMLVKNEEDYEYLHEFVDGHRLALQTCMMLSLNVVAKEAEDTQHNIFSPKGGMFIPFLIGTLSIIGFILCFGLIYELVRWEMKKRRTDSNTNVYEINNTL